MEPILGEIRMFAGDYAPVGWALCDGSVLPISNNETLYTLLGTTHGGDGYSTFAVPDMRGRVPIHIGNAPGLQSVQLGERTGAERVTLNATHTPSHTHVLNCVAANGTVSDPKDQMMAIAVNNTAGTAADPAYVTNVITAPATTLPPPVTMGAQSISASTTGGTPVPIVQPYVVINYIIATVGVYPPQP